MSGVLDKSQQKYGNKKIRPDWPYFFRSFLEFSKPTEAKRLIIAAPKNDEFVFPVFGN